MNHDDLKLKASKVFVLSDQGTKEVVLSGELANELTSALFTLLNMKLDAHPLRVQRWWDTFNAALTGYLATPNAPGYNAVASARELANEAHGKLEDF